jgi:hypothetical protein
MAITPSTRQELGEKPVLLDRPARFVRRRVPPMLRAGFTVLVLGLMLDIAYHIAIGPNEDGHLGTAAVVIHVVVFVGMALTLLGVAATAWSHRPNER